MSVTAWPTLSRTPTKVAQQKHDATLRTPLDDGRQLTTSRATTQRWNIHLSYEGMTAADFTSLTAYEDARGIGAEVLSYTNHVTAATHYVTLAAPISYNFDSDTQTWSFECELAEPGGTYS